MLTDSLAPHTFPLLDRAVIPTPLTVGPETLLENAITCMHQARTSYILSTAHKRPVGIFTERDLVRLVASGQPTVGVTMAAVMSQGLLTLTANDVKDAFDIFHLMQQHRVRHLPVVDQVGHLVGVITRQSLRQVLPPSSLLKLKLVNEVMEPQVIYTPKEASLLTLVQRMAEHNVSCVVIVNSNRCPVGIVTERDVVQFQVLGTNFSQTQAQSVMSTPLLPIHPLDSLWMAHQQMNQNQVRRLVVCTPEGTLAGLITQSSLLKALDPTEIQQAVQLLQQEVEQLRSEKLALLEDRNRELEEQLRLSKQLQPKQLEQQQAETQIQFQAGPSALPASNTTLSTTLLKLQTTEQALQKANADLKNRVEARTAELQRAEHRWRTLLENVHLAVVGLDDNGKVTYANPFLLDLMGYTAAEVLGQDWFARFVPPAQQPLLSQYFQQLLSQSDTSLRHQSAILTQSGDERIIAWNNTLLHNGQDTVTGTMSIGEDITERLVIDRMKGEFVSIVSHELRTPLTFIHGGLKLIAKGLVPSHSEQGQHLLQVAADSSQRLVWLVNNILNLERLESGENPLQKQPLNTRDLTRLVADSFQGSAAQAGIALEVADPGLEIVADGDRLIQALTHLLDNAVKFSPPDTSILLTVEHQHNGIKEGEAIMLFKVQDQGRGIPQQMCTTIFESFRQVDSSDARQKGGTGLGLAICRNIIEQHGGKIWVESTPGKGSCFYFTLPGCSGEPQAM